MDKSEITLRHFILNEMHARDMSARQFAEFIGVSNATISRAIDPRQAPTPSLEFLLKLSDATNVNFAHLAALAYPEVAQKMKPSASSQILAQLIEDLPENLREAVVALIRGGRR